MTFHSAGSSVALPTWSLVISLVMMMLTVLVGVILNLLVVGIILSRKNLRTHLNMYFIHLAVCDLIICCIILILRIVFILRKTPFDNLVYRIDLFFNTLVDISRMFLLVGVSIERYQAVAAPFKKGRSGKLRTIVGCVTSWFVSSVLSLLSAYYYENSLSHVFKGRSMHGNVNTEVYLILPLTFVCLLIIIICYILMLRHLFHHGNKMSSRLKQRGKVSPEVSTISKDVEAGTGSKPPVNRFSRFLNSTKDVNQAADKKVSEVAVFEMDGSVHKEAVAIDNKNNNIVGAVCVYDSKNRVAGKRRVEMRAAKRIGIVMGTFLLLWLPFPVSVVVCRGEPGGEGGCRGWLFLLACISTLTGITNPLLYLLTNKQLKSAFLNSFRSKLKCR